MIKYDFVIVGAGVSGLYLGNELRRMNKSYLILETQNQQGGRIQTDSLDVITFELGAARILSNHSKVLRLVNQLNLELEEQIETETAVFWKGVWYESLDDIISSDKYPNPITLFGELLKSLGIDNLESFQRHEHKEWDNILTMNWLEQNGVPFEWAKLFFIGDIDVNLQQISLYESLFFYLINLSDKEGKIYRLKKGMSALATVLRCGIDQIEFNQNVLKIETNSFGYQIITNNKVVETSNVIFTCSLSALSKIDLPNPAKEMVSNWLSIGHYGTSVKGYFTLKNNPFPDYNYLVSDEPVRFIRRSKFQWEFYLPSLSVVRDFEDIQKLLASYFGETNVSELHIKKYAESPFYGCYWNYKKGNFHKIFEAAKTSELMKGLYSVGEHFSLNPNWIEGSLESADRLLTELI